MPATPEDIARAYDADEAARALLYQEQQAARIAKRAEYLAALTGDETARRAVFEAWAPLARSDGDSE
jgi:hypothetical protein